MFRVTREWIFAHRTSAGGWTDSQRNALGVGTHTGWIERACGQVISEGDRRIFEAAIPRRGRRKVLGTREEQLGMGFPGGPRREAPAPLPYPFVDL